MKYIIEIDYMSWEISEIVARDYGCEITFTLLNENKKRDITIEAPFIPTFNELKILLEKEIDWRRRNRLI